MKKFNLVKKVFKKKRIGDDRDYDTTKINQFTSIN